MAELSFIKKIFFYLKEEFLSYFGKKAPNEVFSVARGPIFFGVFFIWFFIGMFILWATTAKIESAAIARGTIVVESNRKIIQHLEGGIIKEILVKEGDKVIKGQPLIKLDKTASSSNLEQIKQNLIALELERIRIAADLSGKHTITLTETIEKIVKNKTKRQELLKHTRELFASHLQAFQKEVDILEKRAQQIKDEKEGFIVQAKSALKQIEIIKDELKIKTELFQKGYGTKSDVRSLEQKIAQLEGDYGQYQAKIAKANQNIDEAVLAIEKLKHDHWNEHSIELDKINVKISNLKERLIASKDIVDRNIIKSPQGGIVTNIRQHTIGGVVAPGAMIMEIVPKDDRLIIDANIHLNDIDIVHIGLPARVRLLAFKAKKTPILTGVVTYVSPDQLMDPITHAPYFLAKIEIKDTSLIKENNMTLYPGMQTEVLIVTGARTFFEYIIQPISDTMHKAFREE